MDHRDLTIAAADSTLSTSELLHKVVPHYQLPTPKICEFWHKGINDTYKVSSENESFILRVYRNNWRTRSAIEFELDALIHLHRANAAVATPIARKDGEFITPIMAPEGERYVIVTQFAPGSILTFEYPSDAILFGQAVAEIHHCSSGFTSRASRAPLDLNYLINIPLVNIQPYLSHRRSDWKFLCGLATQLSIIIKATDMDTLDYGFCHGDLHGENAHVYGGKVTHFDFDCCGLGWRIYDLATFKWVMQLLGKEEPLWSNFLDGYRSRRKITDLDLNLIEPFIAMRDIWFFGLNASNSLAQGQLNDCYFDLHLNFLKQISKQLIVP
ncbi:aminoglycoside phosphotransferase [Leptolyngbya sp. Heron Island J]|uniref:phosphotransferase enzyme family protein n=1 Tax=Leptolyngbya sp. Heron Island J TaxID=1385935 RepID=UPI0003B9D835|nr:phosphotransferase [Leptolyngbya sp. Heron Island J]ESA35680.1 aminoglycoside phosphotransferase [Leptolyngbya sp. Heron Island J]